MPANIILGKLGEDAAETYLRKLHYKILERNFKIRYGEIDIIAIEPPSKNTKVPTLVFVEVKTRTSKDYGEPLEAITHWKLLSLIKTASVYVALHPKLPTLHRMDAISVEITLDGTLKHIEHVKNISS